MSHGESRNHPISHFYEVKKQPVPVYFHSHHTGKWEIRVRYVRSISYGIN